MYHGLWHKCRGHHLSHCTLANRSTLVFLKKLKEKKKVEHNHMHDVTNLNVYAWPWDVERSGRGGGMLQKEHLPFSPPFLLVLANFSFAERPPSIQIALGCFHRIISFEPCTSWGNWARQGLSCYQRKKQRFRAIRRLGQNVGLSLPSLNLLA